MVICAVYLLFERARWQKRHKAVVETVITDGVSSRCYLFDQVLVTKRLRAYQEKCRLNAMLGKGCKQGRRSFRMRAVIKSQADLSGLRARLKRPAPVTRGQDAATDLR